jgi:VanZ family protein
MNDSRGRVRAAARFLFWVAAAFALLMALLPHPPLLPANPSDKLQHAAAFVVLSALAAVGYSGRWAAIAVGLSAFGALIELLQMIPSLHRDAQLTDWLVDTLAAAAVLLLFRRLAKA